MSNLLKETLNVLKENGKSAKDVSWCGDDNYSFSWDVFKEKANTDYDSGYGGSEVYIDLLIVGDGWWLERHEYDGAEWWEYKEQPVKPKREKTPNDIFCGMFYTDQNLFWEEDNEII